MDCHIGARLRERRQALGLTTFQLGASLGIGGGQVSDFESGAVRIGAAMLARLCSALDTHVSYFFRGAASVISAERPPWTAG
jgi:transcriptional regulator with XRE-family HTH domain